MTIAVDVALKRGSFALDARFTAEAGLTALFGRSGSGKSTIVDLIAGLARPDRGRIAIDGTVLVDTTEGVRLPVHRRRVGYVFQEARLLPHLTVRGNLGFGRFFNRQERANPAEFDAIVAMLGLEPLLDRRPAGLSGGERQRVAIGRALLAKPRVLLMDEPLSALDESRKREILPYVERLRDEAGLPIVYVSHSVAEVARLASTVVMLEAGRVVASGPPSNVLRRADLLDAPEEPGAVIAMSVAAHDEASGLTRLTGQIGDLTVPRLAAEPGTALRLRVPARDVLVATAAPSGLSARNVLPGVIASLAVEGGAASIEIDCNGVMLTTRLTAASVRDLALAPGKQVFAILKSASIDPQAIGRDPDRGRGGTVEI